MSDAPVDKLAPTPDWKLDFVEALQNEPNVTEACLYAGVSRTAAYKAREADAAFRAAWDDAVGQSVDALEARVFGATKVIASDVSARLAMFLLKAHRRNVYGDKTATEHSGEVRVTVRYADRPGSRPAGPAPGTGPSPGVDGPV